MPRGVYERNPKAKAKDRRVIRARLAAQPLEEVVASPVELDNQTMLKLNRLGELEKENFDLKGELIRTQMKLKETESDLREQIRIAFMVIQRMLDEG